MLDDPWEGAPVGPEAPFWPWGFVALVFGLAVAGVAVFFACVL